MSSRNDLVSTRSLAGSGLAMVVVDLPGAIMGVITGPGTTADSAAVELLELLGIAADSAAVELLEVLGTTVDSAAVELLEVLGTAADSAAAELLEVLGTAADNAAVELLEVLGTAVDSAAVELLEVLGTTVDSAAVELLEVLGTAADSAAAELLEVTTRVGNEPTKTPSCTASNPGSGEPAAAARMTGAACDPSPFGRKESAAQAEPVWLNRKASMNAWMEVQRMLLRIARFLLSPVVVRKEFFGICDAKLQQY